MVEMQRKGRRRGGTGDKIKGEEEMQSRRRRVVVGFISGQLTIELD